MTNKSRIWFYNNKEYFILKNEKQGDFYLNYSEKTWTNQAPQVWIWYNNCLLKPFRNSPLAWVFWESQSINSTIGFIALLEWIWNFWWKISVHRLSNFSGSARLEKSARFFVENYPIIFFKKLIIFVIIFRSILDFLHGSSLLPNPKLTVFRNSLNRKFCVLEFMVLATS